MPRSPLVPNPAAPLPLQSPLLPWLSSFAQRRICFCLCPCCCSCFSCCHPSRRGLHEQVFVRGVPKRRICISLLLWAASAHTAGAFFLASKSIGVPINI